jgi:hypothetical protein
MDSIKELRSFCRKQYKIGDKIEFLTTRNGRWEQSPSSALNADEKEVEGTAKNAAVDIGPPRGATNWTRQPRWVVDLSSTSEAETFVVLRNSRVWSMQTCQKHQLKYLASHRKQQQKRKQEQPPTSKPKRANDGRIDNDNHEITSSRNRNTVESNLESAKNNNDDTARNRHSGGKEKRLQAQELISFFVNLVGTKVVALEDCSERGTPPTIEERTHHAERIRDWFNRADGVLDVAGGCGHVSMALGMEGISSTVVDARASVGKLPKRDRKLWKKSLRSGVAIPRNQRTIGCGQTGGNDENSPDNGLTQLPTPALSEYEYCQPVVPAPAVVPFQSLQAWFGSKPDGYDASFRHPEEEDIPVLVATAAPKNDNNGNARNDFAVDERDEGEGEEQTNASDNDVSLARNQSNDSAVLRRSVSALVALHPDEATGEIVEQAVKHRIPFVVVPCCIFARLFPHRTTKAGGAVSSYEDLLDFLQEQDPSIQRTKMSFGGKNIALWSVFPHG